MPNDDMLTWLENWYLSHCNEDWEHDWGIKIGTLDNPGWSVDINLEGTELQDVPFPEINVDSGGNDWLLCRVRNHVFEGRGGSHHLTHILHAFQGWWEQNA